MGNPKHADKHAEAPVRKRRLQLTTLLALAVMLAGAVTIAWPALCGLAYARGREADLASYQLAATNTDAEELEAARAKAASYNEDLLANESRLKGAEDKNPAYVASLDPSDTGVMGILSIPAIDVTLPIYHGTDAAVMRRGAGHVAGTSLPVGGKSTHAVITAHSGEPGAGYFDHLNELQEGDQFTIETLGQTLTYEVDNIVVVKPSALQNLSLEEGQDYVTLMTCTPYGVNTHRLLVRGHRVS